MRLYLSSYLIGDYPEALAELLGKNRRAAVIMNALDGYPNVAGGHEARLARQVADLSRLGCDCEELDLREFFGRPAGSAEKDLAEFGLIWIHGGNSYVLKRAFEQSGCDRIVLDLLARDAIVYAGFSAALVIAAPTVRGFEICDDPVTVPEGYRADFSWDGMGLIPYSIVPHYRSDHPESAMMEDAARYMTEHRMPFRRLHDGEAIVIAGQTERLVGERGDFDRAQDRRAQ
jgi:dipeptidase E